jgi:hypothetical protein
MRHEASSKVSCDAKFRAPIAVSDQTWEIDDIAAQVEAAESRLSMKREPMLDFRRMRG